MMKETAGVRLKKLRLEKGLTLEEVQKRTKIHLNILKAIEEDSLINLNPVYIKGFLKIYCRLLGADPRSIIPDYREIRAEVHLKSKVGVEKDSFLKSASLVFGRFRPRINLRIVFIVIGIAIVIFGALSLIKFISLKVKDKEVVAQKKETSAAAFPKAHAPVSSVIRLGIRARDKCYIVLKTDGKVVLQGELKKGRFESWQAKEKIEFSLGNAGVVDLEVNGKLISSLGKKGQALKNIVVTREGLSIKR